MSVEAGPALEHYDDLATKLQSHITFDSAVFEWTQNSLKEDLNLQPDDLLMDVGGGDGYLTQTLYDSVKSTEKKYICGDTSSQMIMEANRHPNVLGIVCSAENLTEKYNALGLHRKPNKFLFKEVVHHFADSFEETFKALFDWIDTGSEIIIYTRDEICPLLYWEASKQAWNGTNVNLPIDAVKKAGFTVSVKRRPFTSPVSKELYFKRVSERCHSHLYSFSDEEIKVGLAELDEQYPGETVPYTDEFYVIKGVKSPNK